MADLEKLDKAIRELETQSMDLKEFTNVYTEIGNLKNDISGNLNLLKENNAGFEKVATNIQDKLNKSEKQVEKLETNISKQVQEFYQDGKNFQKDLDASLTSRIDKLRSDLQVEIRNEISQQSKVFEAALETRIAKLQKSLEETFKLGFNSVETNLKENFSAQAKELNSLKLLMYFTIVLNVGLAIGLAIKLL